MKINWKYAISGFIILALELFQLTLDNEKVDELEERVEKLEKSRPVKRRPR